MKEILHVTKRLLFTVCKFDYKSFLNQELNIPTPQFWSIQSSLIKVILMLGIVSVLGTSFLFLISNSFEGSRDSLLFDMIQGARYRDALNHLEITSSISQPNQELYQGSVDRLWTRFLSVKYGDQEVKVVVASTTPAKEVMGYINYLGNVEDVNVRINQNTLLFKWFRLESPAEKFFWLFMIPIQVLNIILVARLAWLDHCDTQKLEKRIQILEDLLFKD